MKWKKTSKREHTSPFISLQSSSISSALSSSDTSPSSAFSSMLGGSFFPWRRKEQVSRASHYNYKQHHLSNHCVPPGAILQVLSLLCVIKANCPKFPNKQGEISTLSKELQKLQKPETESSNYFEILIFFCDISYRKHLNLKNYILQIIY